MIDKSIYSDILLYSIFFYLILYFILFSLLNDAQLKKIKNLLIIIFQNKIKRGKKP
jgi:hypothetical protein